MTFWNLWTAPKIVQGLLTCPTQAFFSIFFINNKTFSNNLTVHNISSCLMVKYVVCYFYFNISTMKHQKMIKKLSHQIETNYTSTYCLSLLRYQTNKYFSLVHWLHHIGQISFLAGTFKIKTKANTKFAESKPLPIWLANTVLISCYIVCCRFSMNSFF